MKFVDERARQMRKRFHRCGESYLALSPDMHDHVCMAPPIITLTEISRGPRVRKGTTVTYGDSVFVYID